MPDRAPDPAPDRASDRDEAGAAPRRRGLLRWWPLAVAVPLGAAAGAGYAAQAQPQYQASAYVMVVAPNGGSAAVNFAQAYGRIVGQPDVLARAAAQTRLTPGELASHLEATTSPDAPLIQLTGTAGRADSAAAEANAAASSLVAFGNAAAKQTGVQLVTFAKAAAPEKPSSPSAALDTAVGAAAGLLLGGLVLLVRPGRAATAAVPGPRHATPAAAAQPVEA
ncbi:lipopolysaccharide biosynthesis protein [Streptacidiphilus monticola]|jgi:capsular polysaccharide biosynthesis protein|uniref:Lipopolysaccharide biosynthesis protein n=1 Tax=Streptacidiphilus monticola TaxID=2161674 RepID=A0ABW1G045_9ACTN